MWIIACALALATVSYASWQGAQSGRGLRAALGAPGTQTVLMLAGALFSAGLLATSRTAWWEQALWALMLVLFLVQAALVWRAEPRRAGRRHSRA